MEMDYFYHTHLCVTVLQKRANVLFAEVQNMVFKAKRAEHLQRQEGQGTGGQKLQKDV